MCDEHIVIQLYATCHCLAYFREKQGMLVNDERSSWYHRVDNFHRISRDRRKEILYRSGPARTARQNNPTPESMVDGTECFDGWVWVIYLLTTSFARTTVGSIRAQILKSMVYYTDNFPSHIQNIDATISNILLQ